MLDVGGAICRRPCIRTTGMKSGARRSKMVSGARKWLIFGDQKVDQGMVLVVGESATRIRSCSCVDFGSRIASVRVFSRISAEDE
jgi:hypothetical protein